MHMHKWRTSGVSETSKTESQPIASPLNADKVLGVGWNNSDDSLVFDPTNLIQFVTTAKPCKRSILGASINIINMCHVVRHHGGESVDKIVSETELTS